MKRLSAAIAVLLLSGGLAMAQGTNQGNPELKPASPGDVPVGHAPGANPNNASDMSNRSNPQNMSAPNASNPQLMSPSPSPPVVR
ncbi:MAG TPA: hypothetical protein VGC38_03800 [Pseudolabrys sp.]